MYQASHSHQFRVIDVFEACFRFINDDDKRIEQKREAMIQGLLLQPRAWWQPWRKKHDRESAIAYLKEHRGALIFTQWDDVAFSTSHWRNTCFDLISTISHNVAWRENDDALITLHDRTAAVIGDLIYRLKKERGGEGGNF